MKVLDSTPQSGGDDGPGAKTSTPQRHSRVVLLGAVPQWTGREVRALREARRMSVREFAAHLGVSDRMVSKWEAGGVAIRPRPVNQAALDTSLAQAGDEGRARFASMAEGRSVRLVRQRAEVDEPAPVHLVRHVEDGKLMTLVEPGVFCGGDPAAPHWLDGFYIDVYPTSNADYARFVTATGHRPPSSWPRGEPPADLLRHPVVQVSWFDAQAYARWAAKSLPTGQQWEKAARGPAGATYPWGEHPGSARANVRESRIRATTPVDRYDTGVSPYGVFDLCGNVAEWCSSAAAPGLREIRGGGYSVSIHHAVAARTDRVAEQSHRPDLGFRCVLAVADMLELLSI